MSDHRTFVYLCPTLTLAALASGYHCTFWYVCLRVWMYISVSSVYTVLIWVIIKLCELFAQPPFSTIPRSFSEPRAGRGSRSSYRRLDLIEDSSEDSFEDWCHYEERRPHKTKQQVPLCVLPFTRPCLPPQDPHEAHPRGVTLYVHICDPYFMYIRLGFI